MMNIKIYNQYLQWSVGHGLLCTQGDVKLSGSWLASCWQYRCAFYGCIGVDDLLLPPQLLHHTLQQHLLLRVLQDQAHLVYWHCSLLLSMSGCNSNEVHEPKAHGPCCQHVVTWWSDQAEPCWTWSSAACCETASQYCIKDIQDCTSCLQVTDHSSGCTVLLESVSANNSSTPQGMMVQAVHPQRQQLSHTKKSMSPPGCMQCYCCCSPHSMQQKSQG